MKDYGWLILCIPLFAMLAPIIALLVVMPLGFVVGLFHEPTGRAIFRFAREIAGNPAVADSGDVVRATDTAEHIVEGRQSIARSCGHTSSGGSDWWNQR